MTFQLIPFQTTGPSYQSRSKPLSSQQTANWYQQFNPNQKEEFVLLPFPGLLQSGSFSTPLVDRGMWRMKEIGYQVKGNLLYKFDNFGNHTELGTVPGSGRCIFSDDGTNLIIVTDLRTFIYGSDTGDITESTVVGTTGALSVDIINSQFLFTFSNTTYVATLNNLTKTFTTDGQVGADVKPDNLIRDFVFEQTIWRFGTRTTEAWYNNSSVIPPIARFDGQMFNVGLQAIHSAAKTDEFFYWLGDDNAVYRARSGVKERISTDAISNALMKTDNTNATAYTFTLEGQNFYCITLPLLNKTFLFNEALGKDAGWSELASGTDDGRYQGSSLINVYNENYVADETNGKLYKLDLDTFTNDSEELRRVRVTRSINGKLLGAPGKRVQMSRFELIMETGEGLISGQGENPRIMIEASYDGGRTFDTGTWARTGRLGENVLKVEWFNLKSFYDLILRISTTDPVSYSIYSSTIELRLAGL